MKNLRMQYEIKMSNFQKQEEYISEDASMCFNNFGPTDPTQFQQFLTFNEEYSQTFTSYYNDNGNL
ncbi:12197_t:CDS:2 [Dentiscutata erythropus]|uniref:12197_t:CDS:1 n=1 Tax=Dentiscutata erythropus TaxID=1348616 RepID=A0A9N9ADM6_9GLOM|nr:12197_t:CDS:2 [Dentiscutata erythropus]